MLRNLCMVLVAGAVAAPSMATAQQPGEGGTDELKKLQEQVDKLRTSIREAEAQLLKSKEAGAKKELLPPPAEAKDTDDSSVRRGKFGQGPAGFGQGGFGRGKSAGGGFGGPTGKGFPDLGGFRGPKEGVTAEPKAGGGTDDIKGLETELERLRAAAKTIDALTKEVEGRLKTAKAAQEALKIEEARKKEEARLKDEVARKEERGRGGRGRGASEGGPSGDIEKRLERIEKALEEIQKELRSKR